MSELRMTSMRLDLDLLLGLEKVKARDGIAVTEQVRRAIRAWLKSKRVGTRPSGKRGR